MITGELKNKIDQLWEMLWTEGNANPLTNIGLDRKAANQAFSSFLSDEELNAQQISFVKLIVDYITENGYLDKSLLAQEPFKSYGSIQLLFQHQMPILRSIVQVIDTINDRAGEVS